MAVFSIFSRFWRSGQSTAETLGEQNAVPSAALVPDVPAVGTDRALQIAAVWLCVDRRATIVASLPFFAYLRDADGQKKLDRAGRLHALLHDSPNARMTPFDFWRAMMLQHDLRGNAYARIERDPATGEAVAIWPMPSDQVTQHVLADGSCVYAYRIGEDVAILAESNVLHLRNLGNGTTGLSKLEFMNATAAEISNAQGAAQKTFANGGKPTGVLMLDRVLKTEQREQLRQRFAEMSSGSTSRLFVLEADMKYQQLSLTPEQMQILDTRRYGVEEICRWFDVPPVLAHHSNVTTWGSAVQDIVDGFYKLSIRPLLVNIEQAVRKRVLTAAQRARYSVEFNLDALLRASAKDRAALYAQMVQNGLMTRNEGRQLENLPRDPAPQADQLTVQTNLVPLAKLGQDVHTTSEGAHAPAQDPIAQ